MILANKNQVNYFSTSTFFIGNLAYIEYSTFFTSKPGNLWMGFMDPNAFTYHGILR